MGVPAFFRWLSVKYPKIVKRALEESPVWVGDTMQPIDATKPNPNILEFDNLYLDMNGIIHPCTHPEDGDAPPTEEKMFEAIFEYIERLFILVRPRKILYMAIDGVAPRAKMNQQRSRRFRTALEVREAAEDAARLRESFRKRGLEPPVDDKTNVEAFDSNVITPGTPFMDNLARALRVWIARKQSVDSAWRTVKVVLSDAQSVGEGEHKIMQFVRRQRAEVGYDPNTRHVLYGLDADLIMLGLASHEPHFTVLREEVLFGREARRGTAVHSRDSVLNGTEVSKKEETILRLKRRKPFVFLHVWVLREYLAHEFSYHALLRAKPPNTPPGATTYDLERILDDFVFVCFFVGNDFLPHLPSLSIREGGLDLLLDVYKKAWWSKGYVTDSGVVLFEAVKALMDAFAPLEGKIFQKRLASEDRDKQRKELKRAHTRERADDVVEAKRLRVEEAMAAKNKDALAALASSLFGGVPAPEAPVVEEDASDSADSDEEADAEAGSPPPKIKLVASHAKEFEQELSAMQDKRVRFDDVKDDIKLGADGWANRYYMSKFDLEDVSHVRPLATAVATEYLRGLQWVLQYYYKGCQSWKWFYPYHYAPFASDVSSVLTQSTFNVTWEPSTPFKPFEQLMAVLPSESAHALPTQNQAYMTGNDPSKLDIIDFYPREFEFDPNGKPVKWLWIALLPFIEESRLLTVSRRLEQTYSDDEKRRNAFSPDLVFFHETCTPGGQKMLQKARIAAELIKDPTVFDSSNISCAATAGDVRGGGISDKSAFLPPDVGRGICGFFMDAPVEVSRELVAAGVADVRALEFRLPKMRDHNSALLAGVKMPSPTLNSQDLRIARPSMIHSSASVSNLLVEESRNALQAAERLKHSATRQAREGGVATWGSAEPSMPASVAARLAKMPRGPHNMMPPRGMRQPPRVVAPLPPVRAPRPPSESALDAIALKLAARKNKQ